jgi:hypothetical protein
MKRVLLVLVLSSVGFAVVAQRPCYELPGTFSSMQVKAPTDTLWPGNAGPASTFVMIADSNGGYVLGTNSYHDVCKAQAFRVDTGYIVEGAMFWFGCKKVLTGDSVRFVLWKMDSLQGYTMAGDEQPSPGTELASVMSCMNDVDTASLLQNAFVVMFPAPVTISEDYLLGFDMSGLTTDSIGLMSTSNGEGGGNELVWEKWSLNGTWHTLQSSGWGFPALLDIDAMILPIVDMSSAGTGEVLHINSLSCQIWPNPAKEGFFIKLKVQLASDNNTICLTDGQGRTLRSLRSFSLTAGEHEVYLPAEGLQAGRYFVVIRAAGAACAISVIITE